MVQENLLEWIGLQASGELRATKYLKAMVRRHVLQSSTLSLLVV